MQLPRILATALALTACDAAETVSFERIPLTSSASGHCLVPVTVDGHQARFIVDSGAGTVIVLSTPWAESIGKDLADLAGGTALGGAIRMQQTDVGQFKLGTDFPPVKLGGLQVTDLSSTSIRIDGTDVPPDGLLGVGMLDLCHAVFDCGAPALLVPPHGSPDRSFLDSKAAADLAVLPLLKGGMQMAFIDVEIHGKSRTFLIDTGAGGNTLEPDFAAELKLPRVGDIGSLNGAGGSRVDGVYSVVAERNLIGGKIDPGKLHYLVLSIRAKVQLPEGKTFGGMLGIRSLATLGAFVDFGSYSLAVPTRFVAEKDAPPNP